MTEQIREVNILSRESYEALVSKVPGAICHVSATTTDLQAGYMLGVQAVLQALRGDFVSGR